MKDSDLIQLKKLAYRVKCRTKALAFLRRASSAGIPKDLIGMNLNRDSFEKMLSPEYYGKDEIKSFADFVYFNPEEILNIPFILIDGGDRDTRMKAGCAILFRMITCDKFGLYVKCSELANKFQSIVPIDGVTRNDIIDEVRGYDAVFISECDQRFFKIGFDSGIFFDELLGYRMEQLKPTIISFSKSMSSSVNPSELTNVWGQYLADLSIKEYCNPQNKSLNPSRNILRIRVKQQ